eukprot:scaffold406_cov391-Prasinococcus_capsulatus_cf.AAC.1
MAGSSPPLGRFKPPRWPPRGTGSGSGTGGRETSASSPLRLLLRLRARVRLAVRRRRGLRPVLFFFFRCRRVTLGPRRLGLGRSVRGVVATLTA